MRHADRSPTPMGAMCTHQAAMVVSMSRVIQIRGHVGRDAILTALREGRGA